MINLIKYINNDKNQLRTQLIIVLLYIYRTFIEFKINKLYYDYN